MRSGFYNICVTSVTIFSKSIEKFSEGTLSVDILHKKVSAIYRERLSDQKQTKNKRVSLYADVVIGTISVLLFALTITER